MFRVITEEVGSSSTDSFQKLMRESTRTPSTSSPSGGAYSEFQTINSDFDSSCDINRYSGGEVRSGYERESPIQERLSPFTGESITLMQHKMKIMKLEILSQELVLQEKTIQEEKRVP